MGRKFSPLVYPKLSYDILSVGNNMATLQEISKKIDSLHGDMTYRKVMNKNLNYLAQGRRSNRDFVVKTNMRTLRSGPNRGKVRVDGAVITMYGKRHRDMTETRLVRKGEDLLPILDAMSQDFSLINE
jgi:hypothetical protein